MPFVCICSSNLIPKCQHKMETENTQNETIPIRYYEKIQIHTYCIYTICTHSSKLYVHQCPSTWSFGLGHNFSSMSRLTPEILSCHTHGENLFECLIHPGQSISMFAPLWLETSNVALCPMILPGHIGTSQEYLSTYILSAKFNKLRSIFVLFYFNVLYISLWYYGGHVKLLSNSIM